MISAIIFDMDGTLYNETDVKMTAELETAVYLAGCCDSSPEAVYDIFRKVKSRVTSACRGLPEANDRAKWYDAVLEELGVTHVTGAELAECYWQAVYDNMKPFADFLYVLPGLQEKYGLYLLTDELRAIQERKLQCLGLEHVFLKTVSAQEIGSTKPSEKCYRYITEIIGEPVENILVVGDNPEADIRGGNLAGMHTAWLKRGKYHYYQQEPEEKPEIVFTNYLQLPGKIEALEQRRHFQAERSGERVNI